MPMTEEQIAAMQAELASANDGIKALTAKNQELLGENKRFKAKAKGAEIDPEEHADLKHQLESLQAEFGKLQKSSAKQIESLNEVVSKKDGALKGLVLDNALQSAMSENGVADAMRPAVQALLKGKTTLTEDGDGYTVTIGDKALSEGVAEWAKSDEGKPFIAAPVNSGGGAAGGGNSNPTGGQKKGSFGGDKADRIAAINNRFPELNST